MTTPKKMHLALTSLVLCSAAVAVSARQGQPPTSPAQKPPAKATKGQAKPTKPLPVVTAFKLAVEKAGVKDETKYRITVFRSSGGKAWTVAFERMPGTPDGVFFIRVYDDGTIKEQGE